MAKQQFIPADVSIHFMNNSDRRYKIFKRFSDNIHLLRRNKIICFDTSDEMLYICPLCLCRFTIEALDQKWDNPLTLEDVPPKSIGGKANILTCRDCNNKSGQVFESHMKQYLSELDRVQCVPKSEFFAQVEKDGKIVQGKFITQDDGTLKVTHYQDKNNPKILEQYIESIKTGVSDLVNIVSYPKRISRQALDVSFLKIGYLKTFEKFGYAFILNPEYNVIRHQILNPDEKTYSIHLLADLPILKRIVGVTFIIENGIEAILPTVVLKTNFKTRHYSIFIPLTMRPKRKFIMNF